MKWLCDEYFSYAKQIFNKILMRFSGYTRLINVESTQRMFLLIIRKSQFLLPPMLTELERSVMLHKEKKRKQKRSKN